MANKKVENFTLQDLIDYVNKKNNDTEKLSAFLNMGIVAFLFLKPEIAAIVSTIYTISGTSNKLFSNSSSFLKFFNDETSETKALKNYEKCKIANIILAKLALRDSIEDEYNELVKNSIAWKLNSLTEDIIRTSEQDEINYSTNYIEKSQLSEDINNEFYLDKFLNSIFKILTIVNFRDDDKELFKKKTIEKYKAYKNELITNSEIFKTFSHSYFKMPENELKEYFYSLKEFEERLIKNTKPSINLDFFNYHDEEFSNRLETSLSNNVIYLKARAREEAIFYTLFLIKNEFTERIKDIYIVETIENWNKLNGKIKNKVLIANFDSSEISPILDNTCIFSYGRDEIDTNRNSIELKPRILREMYNTLAEQIGDHTLANEIINSTNGLFSSFKRRVFQGKIRKPSWESQNNADLVPALLISQWKAQDEDKKIISQLGGISYDKYLIKLMPVINGGDPFLLEYLNKSKYKLANSDEAWDVLLKLINKDSLDKFEKIVLEIFTEVPEKYSLPQDERYMASILGKESKYSYEIKKGIAISLIMLSNSQENENYVYQIINKLLNSISTKESWMSISSYIPYFIEASPKVVLEHINKEIQVENSSFWEFFTEQGDIYTGGNYYTSILFALEKSLHFEDCVIDTLNILSKLSELNINYKIANKPISILNHALSAWSHVINISVDTKIRYVKSLVKKNKEIVYDVLDSILPVRTSGLSFTSLNTPTYKNYEFKYSIDNKKVYHENVMKTYKAYLEIAIANAESDLKRWEQILDKQTFFDFDLENEVFLGVQDAIKQLETDEEKFPFKEKIRKFIYENRYFESAVWSISSEQIQKMEENVFNKVIYEDDMYNYLFLFLHNDPFYLTPNPYIRDSEDKNYNKKEEFNKNERYNALKKISEENENIENIFTFISILKGKLTDTWTPVYNIGYYLADELKNFDIEIIFRLESMGEEEIAKHYILQNRKKYGFAILKNILNEAVNDSLKIAVLLNVELSEELMNILEDLPNDLKEEFWKKVSWVGNNNKDWIWKYLIKYKNFRTASHLLEISETIDLMKAFELLNGIKESLFNRDKESIDINYSYEVRSIFEKIYEINTISEEQKKEMIAFEWIFFNWITDSFRGENPRFLEHALKTDPSWLAELIKYPFKSENEEINLKNENNEGLAKQAYNVLLKLKFCPCVDENNNINEDILKSWVEEYVKLINNNYQSGIGMQYLGQCFAYSPVGTDDIFPHMAIRKVFETYKDVDLEKGFYLGVKNKRGIYSNSNGAEELRISNKYQRYADETEIEFPQISKVLNKISRSYSYEAKHEKESAQHEI